MTFSEVMVVLAILGLLILLAAFSFKPTFQLVRARDNRRKTDLKKISIALEDYMGDHPCYPSAIYQGEKICKPTTEFSAYLRQIPCDPQTKYPYVYRRVASNCKQYAIYATLEQEQALTYGPGTGNYAVSSSNLRLQPTPLPTGGATGTPPPSSPTPTPTVIPEGHYYGCFSGTCLPIDDPLQCLPNYMGTETCVGEACCFYQCSNPDRQCQP